MGRVAQMTAGVAAALVLGWLGTALAGSHRDHGWWGRDEVVGSGELATESRDSKEFTRIEVDCAFDIEINVGGRRSLELTFDDNLLELVTTRVRGRTLYLDCCDSHESDHTCRVEISVPELERITVDGAADIEISGFSGEYLEYNLNGAGDLRAEGEVEELEINLSGAGDVDTRDLIAARSEVSLAGAGNISVHAQESFRGSVSGMGRIEYYGDPPRVRRQVSGLGSIRQH